MIRSIFVHDFLTCCTLAAFEYYLFHFAYFLVNGQYDQVSLLIFPQKHILHARVCVVVTPQWSRLTPNISDALYTNLLDTYLHFFLPFTGCIPESFTTSQLQGSPHHYLVSNPPGSLNSSSRGTYISIHSLSLAV